MVWDPDFLARSPLLEPLSPYARAFRGQTDWPRREMLQALLDARGVANVADRTLTLVDEKRDRTRYSGSRARKIGAGPIFSYEARIRLRGELPFREGEWHDLFNVLAWLAYPALKAALNDAHNRAAIDGARGTRRDALTLLDESGAIVLSSDESLLGDLRELRWKRLFVERREAVRSCMRFHVLGHALFEKALRPYIGMTAHAMLLPVSADVIAQPPAHRVAAADALAARALPALTSPRELSPLPLLGVPGWWPDNERAAFYDNAQYFRSGRRAKNR